MQPTLFAIFCTTCQSRLHVRDAAAIGQILACPKCGGMVQVVPPPGWKMPETEIASEPAATSPVTADADASVPGPPPVLGDGPSSESSIGAVIAAAMGAEAGGAAAADSTEPMVPPVQGLTRAQNPASLEGAGGAASAAGSAASVVWYSSKLTFALIPFVVAAAGVGAWAVLSHGSRKPPPPPVAVRPAGNPPAATAGSPSTEADAPALGRIDRRWLPRETRLLFSLRLKRLAGHEEFGPLVDLAGPAWRPAAGRLLAAFGLRPDAVERLTWASAKLAGWPDHAVAVIELAEGQDAEKLIGPAAQTDFRLHGSPVRRLANGPWPHPLALVAPRVIVTGAEDLLRELADRSDAALEASAIDRFLKVAAADSDFLVALDLPAARQSGWPLGVSRLDVWPAVAGHWRTILEMPRGIGFILWQGDHGLSQLALVCEGESIAEKVRTAVASLVPTATAALEGRAKSLSAEVQAGKMAAADADRYEKALARGEALLKSSRCETAEEIVWLRLDPANNPMAWAAAAIPAQAAVAADWLAAASKADEANHQKLTAALGSFQRAEGYLPAGAADAGLLSPDTRLSWIASLLPYYGYREWRRELDFAYSWNSPRNRPITGRRLDPVVNPALGPSTTEAGFPVTHYVGVAGVGADAGELKANDPRAGVFGYRRTTRLEEIKDGASNTLATLGVTQRLGAWAAGGDATARPLTKAPYVNGPDGFGSGQAQGMMAGMADGSVRFISKDVDPHVLEQLATINGGSAPVATTARPTPAATAGPRPVASAAPAGPAEPKPQPAQAATTPPVQAVPPVASDDLADVNVRLAETIPAIDFAGVRLIDAARLLGQMVAAPVNFDLVTMGQLGVTLDDPVTVHLASTSPGEALARMLESRGLACVVEKGQILIISPDPSRGTLRPVNYTVTDLVGSDPKGGESLAGMVRGLVAPDSWQTSGGRGTIEATGGVLKVLQSDAVHRQILVFCEKLRVARGLPLRSRLDPKRFALDTRLAAAKAKLSQTVSVNFHEPAPLERIVSELEELSGTKIVLDWLALAGEGKTPQVPATLQANGKPLGQVLSGLARSLGLAVWIGDATTFQITTPRAVSARLEVEFYPVRDLLAGSLTAKTLLERIKDQVGGATWNDAGGPGAMFLDGPSETLIVLQSQDNHTAVETLLGKLRAEPVGQAKLPAGWGDRGTSAP